MRPLWLFLRLFGSFLLFLFVVLVVTAWVAPTHAGTEVRFDTLVVLGTPATEGGRPSAEMRERVDEAVREYRAGVAPHMILSGGAAHNRFVEGEVMAGYAGGRGVPRSAIAVEGQAKDTIQNIWYSRAIMQRNGWHSAEVISSPYHLPRTGYILRHYRGATAFDWRTHAAHWTPNDTLPRRFSLESHEALGFVKLLLRGFPSSMAYLP